MELGSGAPRPQGRRAGPSSVAALIVAHNQAKRIAATVRGTLAIPGIDLVLVVDDGSSDNTAELARKAGAVVVRQSHRRGRVISLETAAAVVAMRDEHADAPRALLLTEANLGSSAIGAAPLVEVVLEDVADVAVGLADDAARDVGAAAGVARRAIASASGWNPLQPLSRLRCLTREAFDAALPLARGAGLDPSITLDAISAGLTVTEVPCELRHSAQRPAASALVRTSQYRDVMVAMSSRRVKVSLKSTQVAVEDAFHVASARPQRRQTGEQDGEK